VTDFLVDAFRSPDPDRDGRTITVAEVLDRAEKRLDGLAEQPLVRGAMLDAIGRSRAALGFNEDAIKLLGEAVAIRKGALGPDDPQTLDSLIALADVSSSARRWEDAAKLREELFAARARLSGNEHEDTLRAMHALAHAKENAGQPGEAIKLFQASLESLRKNYGDDHPDVIEWTACLMSAYNDEGRTDEAAPLLQALVEAAGDQIRAQDGETPQPSPDGVAVAGGNGPTADADAAVFEQAVKLFEHKYAARKLERGASDPEVAQLMSRLAEVYRLAGRRDDLLKLEEESLQQMRTDAPQSSSTLAQIHRVANLYAGAGRNEEAFKLYEEAIAGRKEKLGPNHPDTLNSLNALADTYGDANRLDRAIPLEEQIVEATKERYGTDHAETLAAMNSLAVLYRRAGLYDESIALHNRTLAARRATRGPNHADTVQSMYNLAYAHRSDKKYDRAIELYNQVIAIRREQLGPDHADTLNTMVALADTYSDAQQLDEAIPLYEDVLALRQEKLGADHADTQSAVRRLATAYQNAERISQALSIYLEHGIFSEALRLTAAQSELLPTLSLAAIAQDVSKVASVYDLSAIGDLRQVAGEYAAAQQAAQAAIDRGNPPLFLYKTLGLALLAQGKTEEAKQAFMQTLQKRSKTDGQYNFEEFDIGELSAAFCLDLISDQQFIDRVADDEKLACVPWFYIAQRHEFAGRRDDAMRAY
jgi:tetratricopeptide (TPR) repeat protein